MLTVFGYCPLGIKGYSEVLDGNETVMLIGTLELGYVDMD
jgi:hypothetical protein